MFGIFKKKEQPMITGPAGAVPAAEAFDLDKEITVHTMPLRFRAARGRSGDHKRTGLLILVLGGLFLVALAAAGYYFLFQAPIAAPAPAATAEPAIAPAPSSEPAPAPAATASPVIATSSAEVLASSSAPAASTSPAKTTVAAPDSDNDGLTDAEEAILGTNPASADSDNDGYGDRAELAGLYDPAGPGKISANKRLTVFTNPTYNYSVIYPAAWTKKSLGGDYSISFMAPDNQFFQIEVQPNVAHQSIGDWYREQFGEPADPARLSEKKNAAGLVWTGVKTEDGRTVYLTDGKSQNIFTLSYNIGLENISSYPGLFELFIRGLEFLK